MIDLGVPEDSFVITGRGRVFCFGPAPEGLDVDKDLMNQDVLIDGRVYRIKGVETFCIFRHGPYHLPYGVLVDE